MNPLPLILDTDIGDDIDDALALALILKSPEFDLLGVTTVFRDAARRAALARQLLRVWNRKSIPVAAGCSKPLLEPCDKNVGSQFELLEGFDENERWPDAIDLIVDKARATDGVLTLCPIGPLTNIALAFAKAPDVIERTRVVLMGGMWNENAPGYGAEWNIRCDPEAAAMVFQSDAKINMIGLDVTKKVVLSDEEVAAIAAHNSPQTQLLSKLIRLWIVENKRNPTLHDPLAVLTMLSDCVQFEEKRIGVALCGEDRGKIKVLPGAANAQVAVSVDRDKAVQLFLERLLV